eukprot:9494150-Pyramimonas_sp.AAC.1
MAPRGPPALASRTTIPNSVLLQAKWVGRNTFRLCRETETTRKKTCESIASKISIGLPTAEQR